MYIDLHSHTTISDGVLEPEELVDYAAGKGIKYLAITDHDATDGLIKASARAQLYQSLTIIPGVELSTDVPGGEVHLLGYYMSYQESRFQDVLANFRQARVGRAQGMVKKLSALGLELEWDRVKTLAGDGSIGRPHVAQALVEKGHVKSVKEAFDKYIGRLGPAYVARERLTPADAVSLLRSANGLPVLAHPGDICNIDELLKDMKKAGLVGMEVHYGKYPSSMVTRLEELAKKYDLIPCGGSDYHGEGLAAKTDLGDIDVPEQSIVKLMELAGIKIGTEEVL